MRTNSGLRSLLNRFLKKSGMQNLGIHLYTFHHTFATMLLERGVNPKIVQEHMGHKKVELTLGTYNHVISRAVFRTIAAALDSAYDELMS